MDNVFDHDIIIHEAGIPPIHTPLKILDELDPKIKEKLYLVHIGDKDVQPYPTLKKNPIGIEHSIVVLEAEPHDNMFYLELIYSISAFDGCYFDQIKSFLSLCK